MRRISGHSTSRCAAKLYLVVLVHFSLEYFQFMMNLSGHDLIISQRYLKYQNANIRLSIAGQILMLR
jgi:hypothetical protein